MKSKGAKLFILVLALSASAACGRSPLLHHKDEPAPTQPSGDNNVVKGDEPPASGKPAEGGEEPEEQLCTFFYTELGLCAQMKWTQGPASAGESRFEIAFEPLTGRDDAPKADSIEVELWMPSMGHGSSPVTVEKAAENRFLAAEVYFFMKGKWEVKVTAIRGGKRELKVLTLEL